MNALPRAARWYLHGLWAASAFASALALWQMRHTPLHPLLIAITLVAFVLADRFIVIYGTESGNQVAMTVVDALAVFLVGAAGAYGIVAIIVGTLISERLIRRAWFKAL